MKRPRIALALEYPLLQQGGTEVTLRALLQGLAERFEIVLITGDRQRAALGEDNSSIIQSHFFWDKVHATPESAKELARMIDGSGAQLAHFHAGNIYQWEMHKARQCPVNYLAETKIPCLVTSHSVPPLLLGYCRPERPPWQRAFLLVKAWMNKILVTRKVRSEFVVSKHDLHRIRRILPMFAGKFRRIYHSKLRRSDAGLPADQRKKVILCLATFTERKGQVHLARAFASIADRHRDWILHMMGRCEDPAYLEELEKIVSALGRQVQIEGPRNDPSGELASASIFALPSLLEPLGLSLQEGLYYECACVASKVGGIPELVENGVTGLLVPPANEAALAEALEHLMSDPALRARLGKNARRFVAERGMLAESMIENHVRLYESILKE
jgi:glycosyltransferase involved in cell wall biosynthesis